MKGDVFSIRPGPILLFSDSVERIDLPRNQLVIKKKLDWDSNPHVKSTWEGA